VGFAVKITFTKQLGGALIPASEVEAGRMDRFKSGEIYEIDIKLTRNPSFHGKVFEFFTFCFNYWRSDREFMDDPAQFDVFRKHMTVLAGYYDEFYTIDGTVRVEAKSISYANMDQADFEALYSALINVALAKIFVGADENIEAQLLSFF
jgi:hypothetical protein